MADGKISVEAETETFPVEDILTPNFCATFPDLRSLPLHNTNNKHINYSVVMFSLRLNIGFKEAVKLQPSYFAVVGRVIMKAARPCWYDAWALCLAYQQLCYEALPFSNIVNLENV